MKQDTRMTKEEITSTRRAEYHYTELQPVRKDFYASTSALIRNTRAERDKARGVDDFALAMYIGNLNRIQSSANEIMRARLSKIARLAVMSAFKQDVPVDHLTPEEREYFERVKALAKDMLDNFERDCGIKTYSPQKMEAFTEPAPAPAPSVPETAGPAPEPVSEPAPEEIFEDPDLLDGGLMDDGDIPADDMDVMPPEPEPVAAEEPQEPANGLMAIRILEDLPPFDGFDRTYNLHREEVAFIPEMFARLLVSNGQAVPVKSK